MNAVDLPFTSTTTSAGGAPLVQSFVLKTRHGLHTRPCVLLARPLEPYRCRVMVECNGQTADASSILGLLTLAAGYDSKLTFTVTGREAAAAMRRIANLFETHFREAYD